MTTKVRVSKSKKSPSLNESRLRDDYKVVYEDFDSLIIAARNKEEISTLVNEYGGLVDISE